MKLWHFKFLEPNAESIAVLFWKLEKSFGSDLGPILIFLKFFS